MTRHEAEFSSRWGVLRLVYSFDPAYNRSIEAEARWRLACHTRHPDEWQLNGIKEIES